MADPVQPDQVHADDAGRRAAQKRRNLWLGLALFAFVIIVGLTTVIRLGDAELGPDGGLYWHNPPQDNTSEPMPDLPEQDGPSGEGQQ
ncbi:MAG: hypothetical protein WA989_03190 [Henriciella sp.]|uniref:hypothetical protein n=1 Tax=Henriciella sp. TaxID=1968823 RepID=UPI003C78387D